MFITIGQLQRYIFHKVLRLNRYSECEAGTIWRITTVQTGLGLCLDCHNIVNVTNRKFMNPAGQGEQHLTNLIAVGVDIHLTDTEQ